MMDKRNEIKRLHEILEWMKEPGVFSHRVYKDHWWRTYGLKYKQLIKQYKKEMKKNKLTSSWLPRPDAMLGSSAR